MIKYEEPHFKVPEGNGEYAGTLYTSDLVRDIYIVSPSRYALIGCDRKTRTHSRSRCQKGTLREDFWLELKPFLDSYGEPSVSPFSATSSK